MNDYEFDQFVQDNGRDILRFCRMTCGNQESGDELYQDTMLKLFEKRQRLNFKQNVKSYALSISILLWKNKKKKYANRDRLISVESIERMEMEVHHTVEDISVVSPERRIIQEDENKAVRQVVESLSEKYRIPIHLHYSANMSIRDIAEVLQIPEGMVKSRMNKAKYLIKKELEALGYDG